MELRASIHTLDSPDECGQMFNFVGDVNDGDASDHTIPVREQREFCCPLPERPNCPWQASIMTILIELRPEEEQALIERARLSGKEPAQYAQQIIREHISRPAPQDHTGESAVPHRAVDDLIDHEFVAACATQDNRHVPTIEQVRETLAKIPGSMAEDILVDREDRF